MPKGTPVERCYIHLKKKMGVASAVRICQASTGLSLKTGQPPKHEAQEGEYYIPHFTLNIPGRQYVADNLAHQEPLPTYTSSALDAYAGLPLYTTTRHGDEFLQFQPRNPIAAYLHTYRHEIPNNIDLDDQGVLAAIHDHALERGHEDVAAIVKQRMDSSQTQANAALKNRYLTQKEALEAAVLDFQEQCMRGSMMERDVTAQPLPDPGDETPAGDQIADEINHVTDELDRMGHPVTTENVYSLAKHMGLHNVANTAYRIMLQRKKEGQEAEGYGEGALLHPPPFATTVGKEETSPAKTRYILTKIDTAHTMRPLAARHPYVGDNLVLVGDTAPVHPDIIAMRDAVQEPDSTQSFLRAKQLQQKHEEFVKAQKEREVAQTAKPEYKTIKLIKGKEDLADQVTLSAEDAIQRLQHFGCSREEAQALVDQVSFKDTEEVIVPQRPGFKPQPKPTNAPTMLGKSIPVGSPGQVGPGGIATYHQGQLRTANLKGSLGEANAKLGGGGRAFDVARYNAPAQAAAVQAAATQTAQSFHPQRRSATLHPADVAHYNTPVEAAKTQAKSLATQAIAKAPSPVVKPKLHEGLSLSELEKERHKESLRRGGQEAIGNEEEDLYSQSGGNPHEAARILNAKDMLRNPKYNLAQQMAERAARSPKLYPAMQPKKLHEAHAMDVANSAVERVQHRPQSEIAVEGQDYYTAFNDLVMKLRKEGQGESSAKMMAAEHLRNQGVEHPSMEGAVGAVFGPLGGAIEKAQEGIAEYIVPPVKAFAGDVGKAVKDEMVALAAQTLMNAAAQEVGSVVGNVIAKPLPDEGVKHDYNPGSEDAWAWDEDYEEATTIGGREEPLPSSEVRARHKASLQKYYYGPEGDRLSKIASDIYANKFGRYTRGTTIGGRERPKSLEGLEGLTTAQKVALGVGAGLPFSALSAYGAYSLGKKMRDAYTMTGVEDELKNAKEAEELRNLLDRRRAGECIEAGEPGYVHGLGNVGSPAHTNHGFWHGIGQYIKANPQYTIYPAVGTLAAAGVIAASKIHDAHLQRERLERAARGEVEYAPTTRYEAEARRRNPIDPYTGRPRRGRPPKVREETPSEESPSLLGYIPNKEPGMSQGLLYTHESIGCCCEAREHAYLEAIEELTLEAKQALIGLREIDDPLEKAGKWLNDTPTGAAVSIGSSLNPVSGAVTGGLGAYSDVKDAGRSLAKGDVGGAAKSAGSALINAAAAIPVVGPIATGASKTAKLARAASSAGKIAQVGKAIGDVTARNPNMQDSIQEGEFYIPPGMDKQVLASALHTRKTLGGLLPHEMKQGFRNMVLQGAPELARRRQHDTVVPRTGEAMNAKNVSEVDWGKIGSSISGAAKTAGSGIVKGATKAAEYAGKGMQYVPGLRTAGAKITENPGAAALTAGSLAAGYGLGKMGRRSQEEPTHEAEGDEPIPTEASAEEGGKIVLDPDVAFEKLTSMGISEEEAHEIVMALLGEEEHPEPPAREEPTEAMEAGEDEPVEHPVASRGGARGFWAGALDPMYVAHAQGPESRAHHVGRVLGTGGAMVAVPAAAALGRYAAHKAMQRLTKPHITHESILEMTVPSASSQQLHEEVRLNEDLHALSEAMRDRWMAGYAH